MANKSVKEIVRTYLKENGYDGLYDQCGFCGCELDDLMPCDSDDIDNCIAGYKVKCDPETCQNDGYCDWHIAPKKDE